MESWMLSWVAFGVVVGGVLIGGALLWRRWRRWYPVQGTTEEAKAAEARLWSTRQGDQTGGL